MCCASCSFEPEIRAECLGARDLPLEQLLNNGPRRRAPAKGNVLWYGGLLMLKAEDARAGIRAACQASSPWQKPAQSPLGNRAGKEHSDATER